MKTDIAYIYALLDPRDNEVRYIGKTINPKRRLVEHLNDSKREYNYRAMWIKSLLKENIKPLIKFLKICPLSDFVKYETEYIQLYKNGKLTNSDETGQGSIGRRQEILDKQSEKMGRIVYQYDLDGNFIQEFRSVRFAADCLSLSHSNISRSCNGKSKHAGGFVFRYDKVIVEKVDNPNAVKKSVIELNELGNKIGKWNSIMACSRDTKIDSSNISRVCNGLRDSIKGRYFKFE
jgi:hypothetical protein